MAEYFISLQYMGENINFYDRDPNWDNLYEGKERKAFQLKDLFEIQVGLVEDKHDPVFESMSTEDHLLFVRISSIRRDEDSFDSLDNLKKKEERYQERRERTGLASRLRLAIPVPRERILRNGDYLITSRGKLAGFSMKKVLEGFNNTHYFFVPSHHFISLRPRPLIDFHISYLHLMLNFLVRSLKIVQLEKKKMEWLERKKKYRNDYNFLSEQPRLDEKQKARLKMLQKKLKQIEENEQNTEDDSYPVLNTIAIKDIENQIINILCKKEDQEAVMNKYDILNEAIEKAKDKLRGFEDMVHEFSKLPNHDKF